MWTAIKSRHSLTAQVGELVGLEVQIKLAAFGTDELQATEGVVDLVQLLAEAGHTLAIASSSSKPLIEVITQKLALHEFFPERVSADEVCNGKPAPDVFLCAAERCGQRPVDCVVIEDSDNGLKAAQSANMRCIGFSNQNSGNQRLVEAGLVVPDFSQESIQHIIEFIGTA